MNEQYKTFNQNEVSDFIKNELAKQNEPLEMDYIGYSSHDAETWYKCPKCGEKYGGWSFVNGSIILTDGMFKCCKCKTILKEPR